MVEVAMCADYVVLELTGWIERFVVVYFDWVVFDVVPEVGIAIYYVISCFFYD